MDIKTFLTGYKGKDIPKELNEFNWAAFLLTFLWGIPHKAWITLIALPLIWIQMPLGFNWILFTIFQLYCGFKGNMWAYQHDWWMKPSDFRHKQMKWAICAFLVTFIVPIIILIIAIRFINKSPDNPIEFISNAQCSIVDKKLKQTMPKLFLNENTTSANIAKQFSQKYKHCRYSNDTVIFSAKSGHDEIDIYTITIEKMNKNCSIPQKNCRIKSSYAIPQEMTKLGECTFYFDNNKNYTPDKQTKDALKKGMNLLKYL